MSRLTSVPVVGGSYADDTRPFTIQDTVNWLPTGAEGPGTRSPMYLKTPPGLREFCEFGTGHRGVANVEGKLFCVSGAGLYQVTNTQTASYLGKIPGTGRVSMAHNQITGGNELLIVNGSAGYIWSTVTETLTRITDPGYPGAKFAEYMNHTFMQTEPQGRFAFPSALDDGLNYNTTERFQGESKPDRIVGHVVANGEYQLFNEGSMDHFEYTGVTNELLRNKNIPIDRGCASGYSICLLDNAVFFVGNDGSGYEKRGYEFRRITTHAIEQAWAACDIANCYAFAWEDRGYKVWYVTFPDGHTWGYDCSTRLWHRRASYGSDRWRLATMVAWNDGWYGGDSASGMLYVLDWDYVMEACNPLVRERATGPAHDSQNVMTIGELELVFDTGGPETTCIHAPPPAALLITGDVPDGAVGDGVSLQYEVSGGVGPYTVTLVAGIGEYPPGLDLSPTGLNTGTYTTEGEYTWRVRARDILGNVAYLDDGAIVIAVPVSVTCGLVQTYAGGPTYPGTFPIVLGTDTGEVAFKWATGEVPDKAEVWFDGVKVIDTGYTGQLSYQSALDAALTSLGDPTETISVTRGSVSASYETLQDFYSFTKGTATTTAEVRVYAPLTPTNWTFSLQCPATPDADAQTIYEATLAAWDLQQASGDGPNAMGAQWPLVNSGVDCNQTTLSLTNLPKSVLFNSTGDYLVASDLVVPAAARGGLDLSGCAWIRLNTVGTAKRHIMAIQANGETSATNTQAALSINTSGAVEFLMEHGSGVDETLTFTGFTAVADTDYFASFERDATAKTVDLYIDGAFVDTQGYASQPNGGTSSVYWVGHLGGVAADFDGYVTGVRWMEGKIGASGHAYLYNSGDGRSSEQIANDAGWPA